MDEGYSEGIRASFMPYLTSHQIISNYYKNIPNFSYLYYLPFYRYIFIMILELVLEKCSFHF